MKPGYRSALRGALLTVLTLFGGLLIGLFAGDITFRLIPGSSVTDVKLGHAAIAAIPALIGFLAGGAAWGVQMGRLTGNSETRTMALAGMLGFGPITILLAAGLGLAEPALVANLGQAGYPIHRVFTLLFVPSAFLIAGISAWAVGRGLRDHALSLALFWQVGLTAAVTFLVVNLVMESFGWVVGALGAAERATMITVLALGNIAAALTGGAMIGCKLNGAKENKQSGRIIFLITGEATNGEVLEMKAVYPAHSERPRYHYHPYQEEHFEVLKGKFHTKIGDVECTYEAGGKFHVAKNTPHWMYNISDEDGCLLWKVSPAMKTQAFLETMWGLEADGKFNAHGMPNLLQLAVILQEYSDEFRVASPPYWVQRILFGLLSPIGKLFGYRASYPKYHLEMLNQA